LRFALRVTPIAEQQIREAADWWRHHRRGAYALFGEQLQRGFELATTQPNAGVRAHDLVLAGVRRLLLSRIRYHLYYTVQGDVVEVLALWHGSRGTPPPI
jgi:plasmid stabilization system protein ParE